jgi:hypothetical protein
MTSITLRASLRADQFGGGYGLSQSFHFNQLGLEPCTEAVLTYRVRLPYNAILVKGGKLPGLASASRNEFVGGRLPNMDEGWSMRMMFHPDQKGNTYRLSGYPYLPLEEVRKITQPSIYHSYGGRIIVCDKLINDQKLPERPLNLPLDRYREIKQHIRLNTIGEANGVLGITVNGELLVWRENIVYRTKDTPETMIGRLMLSLFFGGDASWVSDKPETLEIDIADLAVVTM